VKDKIKVTSQNVGGECWFLLRRQSESNETMIYNYKKQTRVKKKNKKNKYKSHFGDNVRESGK